MAFLWWRSKKHAPVIKRIRERTRSLMRAPPGETWREALDRFQRLMAEDLDAYVDDTSGDLVILNFAKSENYVCDRRENADDLEQYAKAYDFSLPSALKTLMCDLGCFRMPVGNSRDYAAIYATWRDGGRGGWSLKGIRETLKWNYGAFPEGLFSADELAHFERQFLFFGCFASDDDGRYTYMFVDRTGRYGLFRYIEEDWPDTRRNFIEPITAGTHPTYDLDTLISKLVDSVIERSFAGNEVTLA